MYSYTETTVYSCTELINFVFQGILQLLQTHDSTANNRNTYLQVVFDTGSCKTFATIAGHLQKAAGVRLPTSSQS